MCELLGMSANVPTDICFSFTGLMQRGGETGPHQDGWGIGLYEGKACRTFHDPNPSAWSEVAKLIRNYAIKSKNAIAHIRKANRGRVCLSNTHPFTRELWGNHWLFAHNGQLRGIKDLELGFYRRIGTTDSEHAFCWMMNKIRKRFPQQPRSDADLFRYIRKLAVQLDKLGVFNFILCDSRNFYVYCSTRMCWLTRKHPFGRARLIDTGESIDFSKVTTPRDVVTIVASRALTDKETWIEMKKGEFLVFRNGKSISRSS
ncbi:MAG: class II glutamine amidotransferase [Thiotrichales bacterium]|nr:class II glutamine amidotransferase [Thiotrichales bacterium]